MKQKFVSIGECMVEMAPSASGDYRLGFAGDTLNTAWYAKRTFGGAWEIAYLTAVGDDEISRRMTDFMRDAGIRTDYIQKIPDRTVGLYLIQLKEGERSFAYWRSDSAARQLAGDPSQLQAALEPAGVIYFSGITLAILSPDHRKTLLEAISGARRNGALVAFDPNLRPRLWDDAETMRQVVMSAAAVSDIILPSHEDEAVHFGDPAPEATASRYADAGAALVVVKNGPGEIVSLDRGEIGRQETVRVDSIVDTTAAGDSFNAGFLAAHLERGDLAQAIRSGAELAARVIAQRGALVD